MKKVSSFTKRIVAILLSGMLAVGTIPGTVLAAEVQESTVQEEEAITTYAVTLDANGGYFVNEWDDVLGEYIESTETLNKLIPVGGTVKIFPVYETDDQQTQIMSFVGWSLEKDGELVSQWDEGYTPVDSCVLYAVWEPAEILDNGEETDLQESDQTEGVAEDDSSEEQQDTEDNSDDADNIRDTENPVNETEDYFLEDQEDTEDKSDDAENIGDMEDFSDGSTDTEEADPKSRDREEQSVDIIEEGKEEAVRTDGAMSVVASGTCGDNLTWTLDSVGTLTISGTGEMDDYRKIKVGTYSGFTAGTIPPWFDMRDSIERIVISEGVTSIGTGAFTQAGANDMVEYISIPNSLTSIRDAAFAYTGCPVISFGDHSIDFKGTYLGVFTYAKFDEVIWGYDNLNAGLFCDSKIKKITFTGNIKTIPNRAFSGCSSLISVSIPSGVEKIGESAFWQCDALEDVAIPGTVENIEKYAFGYCDSLSKVTIGQGVKTIGESAFEGCKNLNQLKLPVGLTQIGRAAFTNCDSMETIIIPEGVVIIDVIAFDGCDSLKSVTLPKSLVTIENSAFRDCPKLTKIDIPENVNSICTEYNNKSGKYSSFAGASSLVDINVASGNNTYKSFDGCLYNYDLTELLYCPEGKTSLLISPSTTSIDQSSLRIYSFDGNITDLNLKEIYFGTCSPSIPDNLLLSVHKITAYYNNFLGNWLTEKRQNYGGAITWVEKALNLSECTMVSDPGSYTFDGTAKKLSVTLKYSGKTLTNNTDYTVSYTNNVNAGTGTVIVTGKGSFTGSLSKTFTISKASPVLSFASTSVSKKTTDGAFINTLTKKTDGTITFSSSNNSVATVNSSTGQVTIKGAGSATITANAAAGANYNSGSASYTLTVAQASKTFMVTYDTNGGSGTPSSQIKQENVPLVLSNIKPTKRYTIAYNSCGGSVSPASKSIDCTFKNWNTAKNGSGTSYAPGGIYNTDAESTLYAQWTNPKAGELATPTRSGYSFAGWYTASSGGNQITDSSIITGNVTLYAHWKDPYNLGDETYSFKNYKDLDSNGHCFGMSITSAGYENNLLDIKRIGGNENTPLYSFNDTSNVRKPICYYQDKQGSYREYATVAGGSHYLHGVFDISSDWQGVVNYVRSHKYDNTGLLQIGIRKRREDGRLGGHAVNFLRYDRVNGQDRLYAYDNNFPNQETYFYRDTSGNVLQAPIQTFSGAIDCICLRDARAYFSKVSDFDATHVVYMDKDAASIEGYSYTYMDTGFFDNDYIMYEIPANIDKVTIVPNKDYADFVYLDTEFSFDEITEATRGELRFSSLDDQEGGVDTSFIIYEENVANPTVTLSKTSFVYNGSVQKPEVTVKAGSAVLKESKDYSVEYPSGMINVGDYKIKVTLKGKYSGVLFAAFNINKAAQSLTLKTTASSITVGKTATVSITGNKGKVTYTSSNTAIATVNASTGVVTGKKAGTVTITASVAATANYNAASKTIKITVTAGKSLKKPGNCHFAKWNNSKYTSCRIAWNKVDGAEGYETLLSWTNGSHASRTIVKTNVLYRDCTVHPQHVSQMMVRAFYTAGGKRVFGPWSNVEYITPSPTKLTTKNASSGTNLKMNISWNIIYGCNGYNVFLTTNPNGTWYWNQSTSTKADATSAVITKYRGSKLKKNTRYYVRIVTRRQRNGVFCTVPMPASNTYIGSFIIK